MAVSSGGAFAGGLRPKEGSRKRSTRRKLAAMLNRISACRIWTRLLEMPASACMTEPPAWSAPNRIDARRMPTALPRPSSATAMASKPVVSLKYLSVRLWSTPAIWITPASPENALAMPDCADLVAERRPPKQDCKHGQGDDGDKEPGVHAVHARRQPEDDEAVVIRQKGGQPGAGSDG